MTETSKAILLVADISGYTKFMRLHAISTSHAKQITVRLLKSIIFTSKPPLKVAEVEGDGVFFYAVSSEKDIKETAKEVKSQVVSFFTAFNNEITALKKVKACVCDACTNVGDLKLKQVIHTGEVAIERIERFEKLFGIDVILVHRMLKNSIPDHEYVSMTDPMYAAFGDFYGLTPERHKEDLEGVGTVEMLVFYPSRLPATQHSIEAESSQPAISKTFTWKVNMHARTLLDLLGVYRIRRVFRNLPA